MISLDTRLAGGMGSLYVSGTTEVTGLNRFAFIPREAATITSITGTDADGSVVDILALLGLTNLITLNANELWIVPADYTITAFKGLTGTFILY